MFIVIFCICMYFARSYFLCSNSWLHWYVTTTTHTHTGAGTQNTELTLWLDAVLCKCLELPLISLYFASEEPEFLVIFKGVLSRTSPDYMKVFQGILCTLASFSLHLQSIPCIWSFLWECFCLFVGLFKPLNTDL